MDVHHDSSTGFPMMVIVAQKAMDAMPQMWIYWVVFVFVGPISLMALVPAIFVSINLRDAEKNKDKDIQEEWSEIVKSQREQLEKLFRLADTDNSDSLSREEMEEAFADEEL